jgi:molybdopterin/thiamine biosynthesis adenylyltransferase
MTGLDDRQERRYARHLILDEIGEEGQARLLAARVLVVGAGGLGSPALLYLAAAGVGTLGIVDDDVVELSNLQRQILHADARLGMAKTDSAVAGLAALNPEIRLVPHRLRLDAANAPALIAAHDLVVDGSDNFATRYVLNDACAAARKPLVAASLLRFEGQISTFKPWTGGPCYRCLHPQPPPPGIIPRCEEAGILGAVAGVMGTLQAVEAIKELLGLGTSLSGTLLLYDALDTRITRIRVAKDPACPSCGPGGAG